MGRPKHFHQSSKVLRQWEQVLVRCYCWFRLKSYILFLNLGVLQTLAHFWARLIRLVVNITRANGVWMRFIAHYKQKICWDWAEPVEKYWNGGVRVWSCWNWSAVRRWVRSRSWTVKSSKLDCWYSQIWKAKLRKRRQAHLNQSLPQTKWDH